LQARECAVRPRSPTASWTGGQIAQAGASGEMQKVVEWQYLRRDERIFILSAVRKGRHKSRACAT
jgi:hypothetical protein